MFGQGWYYGFDSTYVLVIIGLVLCLAASAGMKRTFAKYSKVRSYSGITGAEAAQRILHRAGITDVRVEHVAGDLSDHYDPRSKVLRLSDRVYSSNSLAAVGVAAHECGHAIQHNHKYAPLAIRSAIVPVANIGSTLAWPLFILGFILDRSYLLTLGIILFAGAVLFQLITLPVETNASKRALVMLRDTGILGEEELSGGRKVLRAAALTYVASLAASILQLVRLIALSGGRRRG
jgi:uncharacterized protein